MSPPPTGAGPPRDPAAPLGPVGPSGPLGAVGAVGAVAFDLDGTLVDLAVDWHALRQLVARRHGVPEPVSVFRTLAALPEPDRQRLDAEIEAHELAGLRAGQPRPGAAEILALQSPRLAMGVVTRNASAVARQALRLLDRSTLPVVGRHDTGRWKPHPEALLTLLDRLGVSPPDTVVVGDSWHDVAMARRAGARAVVVRHERGPAPDGADLYVDSLLQLSELLTRPVLLPPTR